MSLSNWFKLEFEILTPTEINDGGILTKTYSVALTVPGLMRQLNGNEVFANEKLGYKSTHRFYCDVDTIDIMQLIKHTPSGKYYEIRNIKNPMEFNHHLEIDCEYNPDLQIIGEESS